MKKLKLLGLGFLGFCVLMVVIGSNEDKSKRKTQSDFADGVLHLPTGHSVHVGESAFDASPEMMPYFGFYEDIPGNGPNWAGNYYYEIHGNIYCLRIRHNENAASSHDEYYVSAIDSVDNNASYQQKKQHAKEEMEKETGEEGSTSGGTPPSGGPASVAKERTTANDPRLSKEIKTQSDFEHSEFCQQYHCKEEGRWLVHSGDVNHTYHTSVSDLGVEMQVNSGHSPSVTGFGLMFPYRDQLSNEDFNVIAALVRSANHTGNHDKTMSFIKKNVERDVDQIKMANSIDDGDFRIWAGKVMQQTIEFQRISSPTRP